MPVRLSYCLAVYLCLTKSQRSRKMKNADDEDEDDENTMTIKRCNIYTTNYFALCQILNIKIYLQIHAVCLMPQQIAMQQ